MELTEDGFMRDHLKQCMRCLRSTLLPYEYEGSCVACCCNIFKRTTELSQSSD